MRIDTLQPQLNLECFYDFVRMNQVQKMTLLLEEATFLDLDCENEIETRLYFLKGFFVEEIICRSSNTVIDVLPFKQGYRIERFIEVKSNPLPNKPVRMQWCVN